MKASPPRLAMTRTEAAEALGVSFAFFSANIAPDLRVIRRGRKVLVSVAEVERWLKNNEAISLEADR